MAIRAFTLVALALTACGGPPTRPCATAALGEGLEKMVCIPGGTFRLGHGVLPPATCKPLQGSCNQPANNWAPAHDVELSPFFLDAYEVTWSRFERCIDAGGCPPALNSFGGPDFTSFGAGFFTEPGHGSRPLERARFEDLVAVCAFEGKRLPTEAEWERAARGPESSDFPWGDEPPRPELRQKTQHSSGGAANASAPACLFPGCIGIVGSDWQDRSFDGVFDLYGGAIEWVSDWNGPYPSQLTRDPRGPAEGTMRLNRGDKRCLIDGPCGGPEWGNFSERLAPVWLREPVSDIRGSAGGRCARDDR